MTYEPIRSSCQRDTEGRKCGVEGGGGGERDEDEILLLNEVCCATGFKVRGKEICVGGDWGQNNEFRIVMMARYQQDIWRGGMVK